MNYNIAIIRKNNVFSIVSEDFLIKLKEKQAKFLTQKNTKYDAYKEALKIKLELESKGLTQAEYARIIGCSRANITKRLRHLKKLNK
jgi:Fic family protein